MHAVATVSDYTGKVLFLWEKDLLSFSSADIHGQKVRDGGLRNAQDPPDKSSR